MRFPVLALLAFFSFQIDSRVHAGSVETLNGDIASGKVELSFGGILFRPEKAPVVKMDLSNIYRVSFRDDSEEKYVPGVVLKNGARLAAPWGPFNDPVVKFPKRNLSIPAGEIAWIIYNRFPASLAINVPGGQTGALLPQGDFYEGTIRGADESEVKVFNSIFGLRTFHPRDLQALVLRDAHLPVGEFEVRTNDGSLFPADYLAMDTPGVTIKHALYDNMQIPAGEIAEIRAGANRCRPLAAYGQLRAEPAEGLQIQPDFGFTLAPKSVATCPVPQGFPELIAKVAADDSTPAGQRLVFSILADGRLVSHSTPMAANDPPQSLHLAISGMKNLVLRVDATGTPGGETRGHWIQAMFLRR